MTIQEIITDEEIEDVFEFTDFGGRDNREVISTTLLKIVCGYSPGSTAWNCVNELKLLHFGTNILSKKGQQYLYEALKPQQP